MSEVQSLLVVWQDKKSRSYYHVGTLSYYNGLYEFSYTSKDGDKKLGGALKNGYMIHPVFPDTSKTYRSEKLFPSFDRRIPSPTRQDYNEILADLGLDKNASRMDILRATRGRLGSDTYSFEKPLRIENNNILQSTFFVHGMRYRLLPTNWPSWIKESDELTLVQEQDNEADRYAVAIYAKNGKQLGYIPTFYSNAIFSLIEFGLSPKLRVVYVNKNSHPDWWIQVEFECEVPLDQKKRLEALPAVI